jgi:hypothetical protein
MIINISDDLKKEIEKLSVLKNTSSELMLKRLFNLGFTVQKKIDSESQVLILNPTSNRNSVILISTSK